MNNYNLVSSFLFCILPYILVMSFLAYYGHRSRLKTAKKIAENTLLLQQDPGNLYAQKQMNKIFMMIFVGMVLLLIVLLSFVFFMIPYMDLSFVITKEKIFFGLLGVMIFIFFLLGIGILLFMTFKKQKK